MYSMSDERTKAQIPILVEISNIVRGLLNQFGNRMLFIYIMCAIGAYLLFFGILTRKLSLSFIFTMLLTYYTETISGSFIKADKDALGDGLFRKFYDISLKIHEMTEKHYAMMLAVAFVVSSLLILLIGTVKYVFAFIAIYLFYDTYISYFVQGDQLTKIFFFGATFLLLFTVFILFEKLLRFFLIMLYSFTGTLIFLVTMEVLLNMEIGIIDMLDEMGNKIELTILPKGVALFGVFCTTGIVIQLLYIPSIPFL